MHLMIHGPSACGFPVAQRCTMGNASIDWKNMLSPEDAEDEETKAEIMEESATCGTIEQVSALERIRVERDSRG